MTTTENKISAILRPAEYWRLWTFNALLVSTGILLFLAAQYGTREFFGRACLMALLPLIPFLVLVGGAGSTVFALTKVLIDKRGLKRPAALALLIGPGVMVTIALALLGATQSPLHRLNYICLGNAPASASRVQIAGYSTFLRKEWLAVFEVRPADFQTLVARSKLVPVDEFEFKAMLDQSLVKETGLYQNLPPMTNALCFKRVFNGRQEHESGSVYAAYDPAAAKAVVVREDHE